VLAGLLSKGGQPAGVTVRETRNRRPFGRIKIFQQNGRWLLRIRGITPLRRAGGAINPLLRAVYIGDNGAAAKGTRNART